MNTGINPNHRSDWIGWITKLKNSGVLIHILIKPPISLVPEIHLNALNRPPLHCPSNCTKLGSARHCVLYPLHERHDLVVVIVFTHSKSEIVKTAFWIITKDILVQRFGKFMLCPWPNFLFLNKPEAEIIVSMIDHPLICQLGKVIDQHFGLNFGIAEKFQELSSIPLGINHHVGAGVQAGGRPPEIDLENDRWSQTAEEGCSSNHAQPLHSVQLLQLLGGARPDLVDLVASSNSNLNSFDCEGKCQC
jgi:hypothetical protein